MQYDRIDRLNPSQVEELAALYQSEWWTAGRSREDVVAMLEHSSLVFGLTSPEGALAGFARVLTDRVYKAFIFDVIVSSSHRKTGLGGELMRWILSHPELARVRHFELYCLPELQPFYEQWGFSTEVGDICLMRRGT